MKKRRIAGVWVALLVIVPLLLIGLATFNYIRMRGTENALAFMQRTDATAKDAKGAYDVVKDRKPPMRDWPIQKLTTVPSAPAKPGDGFAVDFRWKDASSLDLQQSGDLLSRYASFGTETVWPKQMPAGFDPKKYLELGKDPGLGIRALHAQGITGKGVKVAFLDQTLLRTHQEYKDQVDSYTEVGMVAYQPELHGAAVASLLAGKSIGVAPGVTLDYWAVEIVKDWKNPVRTFLPMAQTINRILDQNKKLPKSEQVRVIGISNGVGQNEEGYAEMQQAYQRAIQEGVLVVTTDMNNHYPYWFMGLGRQPDLDPNDPRSYSPGDFWAASFFDGSKMYAADAASKAIYVPMDSRTVASPMENDGYTFYREGGMSWSMPYAAGVYALALQKNVNLTPDQFLKAAYETGDYITVTHDAKEYKLGPILNPKALLAKVGQ